MVYGRRICCGLLLVGLTACGSHPPPPAGSAAPAAAPPAAAATPGTPADPGEGPRLTLSPDNVHIEYHLYGHGASASNRSDWSIANYAQDVVAVARDIPNRQLILVGHSMGAAVALMATPLLGTRVIGVIAVEALRSVGEAPGGQAKKRHLEK